MISALVLAGLLRASAQQSVPFFRSFTSSENKTYTVTFTTQLLGGHTTSFDIGLSIGKVVDPHRATVTLRMSNKQSSGQIQDTSEVPPDLSYTVGKNAMPEKYEPRQGDASIFEFILFVASSTPDKEVKVGEEIPWAWSGKDLAITGSTKVLDISPEKKTLKALITQKMTYHGQDAGTFRLTSLFDTDNGSLVSSDGTFEIQDVKQELKVVRKTP